MSEFRGFAPVGNRPLSAFIPNELKGADPQHRVSNTPLYNKNNKTRGTGGTGSPPPLLVHSLDFENIQHTLVPSDEMDHSISSRGKRKSGSAMKSPQSAITLSHKEDRTKQSLISDTNCNFNFNREQLALLLIVKH